LPAGKLPHALLARLLEEHVDRDPSVVVGPGLGRDAAVVHHEGGYLVVKSDPITFAADRAAEHLVHVNANDLACMGARPRWLLVTALFPEHATSEALVERTFRELRAACASAGVALIGGHTEITLGLDRPLLIGSMLGEVAADGLVDPTRARAGDRLLMTKSAGIEGTAVLAAERRSLLKARIGIAATLEARGMLDGPGISIVREARLLADGLASALHDPTEGGIATAVHELAAAAGLGAFIARDRIPVTNATVSICAALGLDSIGLLASGSLLAAIPGDRAEAAERRLDEAGIAWSWIGKLTPPEFGLRLREGSDERDLPLFSTDEATRALAATADHR
jgi:hydrogenase maturation factor